MGRVNHLSRRQVLLGIGASSTIALSGCSLLNDSDGEGGGNVIRVADIILENLHGETHALEAIVSINDEIRYWETHHLA